jgi:hypothetical protein
MDAENIQHLLKAVEELKASNEHLIKKVKNLEENVRQQKTDVVLGNQIECEVENEENNAITKKELCEHVEEVISSFYPLKDGWRATYSEENERIGYYDSSDRKFDEPPPAFLFWDRSRFMKKPVITLS